MIDVYDSLRHGSLAMEHEWYTQCWWNNLGMCIVDAYMAHQFENDQDPELLDSITTFVGKLSHQFIFNEFLETGSITRRKSDENKGNEVRYFCMQLTILFFSECHTSKYMSIQDTTFAKLKDLPM